MIFISVSAEGGDDGLIELWRAVEETLDKELRNLSE
jgi:hypothetical protein